MNYSVFGRFQWIRVDANILKTMTRKTEKKKIVLARVDRASVELRQLKFRTTDGFGAMHIEYSVGGSLTAV